MYAAWVKMNHKPCKVLERCSEENIQKYSKIFKNIQKDLTDNKHFEGSCELLSKQCDVISFSIL